jgi:hypothetical protein
VWGASGIAVNDQTSVTLSCPDGRSIRWTFAGGNVTRSESHDAAAGREPQHWTIESTFQVQQDGSDLVLRGASDREQSMVPQRRFISQIIRATGGRQS